MLVFACREMYAEDFPVYLCHWHVKRAWLQNLLAKCDRGKPAAVFQRLSHIMVMLKHHDEPDAAFLARIQHQMEALYQEFADQSSCVDYIQRQWGSETKLSMSCSITLTLLPLHDQLSNLHELLCTKTDTIFLWLILHGHGHLV